MRQNRYKLAWVIGGFELMSKKYLPLENILSHIVFIFEKQSDEDASYWNACCKPAQNVKCPNISIIEPRGNVQNVQTFSNSQIYQNSDLFNN